MTEVAPSLVDVFLCLPRTRKVDETRMGEKRKKVYGALLDGATQA